MQIQRPPEECYGIARKRELDVLEICDWIMSQFHVVSMLDTDELMFYQDGVYHTNGEKLVNRVLEQAFGRERNSRGGLLLNEGIKRKVRSKIRDTRYMDRADFDDNPDLINMENGLYNWRTGELLPHDPEYRSIVQIPVKYDPKADCPNIKRSFGAVFYDRDLVMIREFIAYCLFAGYPIQKAFILYSAGDSGKSFIMNIIRKFLGPDHCAEVGLQALGENRFAAVDLVGKMINACGDLDASVLKYDGEFKKATSGLDPMRVEQKGEEAFTFINRAKFIFGTNGLAKVNDQTLGFFRRIVVLHTTKLRKEDIPGLPGVEAVSTPEEMSGLFNWVIELLGPLLERRHFYYESSVDEVRDTYIAASEPIATFWDKHMEEVPGCKVTKDEVYEAFENFCRDNFVYNVPKASVFWRDSYRLHDHTLRSGEKVVNRKRKACVLGFRLKGCGYDDL